MWQSSRHSRSFGALTTLVTALSSSSTAIAESGPLLLDRERVVALARTQEPRVITAEARVGEGRALHVGARALSTSNPEVAAFAGPRFYKQAPLSADWAVSLAWPFDISGSRTARSLLAEERTREAEAQLESVRRSAVADALDLWVRTRGALERIEIEMQRKAVDGELLSIARTRRANGVSGDGDLALAVVLQAEAEARLRIAQSDQAALAAELRGLLGLEGVQAIAFGGPWVPEDSPSLDALLASLPFTEELLRAERTVQAAKADDALQHRIGVPIPRLTVAGGQEPEFYAHAGVALPLPVYQTNQTPTAVAEARVRTARIELANTRAMSEAYTRAAYETYRGTYDALTILQNAAPSVADAEALAVRAYQLGQAPLATAALARREAIVARTALLDARISAARARVAIDRIAGRTP